MYLFTQLSIDRKKRHHFSKFHSFKSGDIPTEPYPQAMERYRTKPRPSDLDYVSKLKEVSVTVDPLSTMCEDKHVLY